MTPEFIALIKGGSALMTTDEQLAEYERRSAAFAIFRNQFLKEKGIKL